MKYDVEYYREFIQEAVENKEEKTSMTCAKTKATDICSNIRY